MAHFHYLILIIVIDERLVLVIIPQEVNEVEIIEEVPLTDGTVDDVQTAEVVEK